MAIRTTALIQLVRQHELKQANKFILCCRIFRIVRLSDVININFLGRAALTVILTKLELDVSVLLAFRLVDDGSLGNLTQGLQTATLIRSVLEDDVCRAVLEVAEGKEDQITSINPDLAVKSQHKYNVFGFVIVPSCASCLECVQYDVRRQSTAPPYYRHQEPC